MPGDSEVASPLLRSSMELLLVDTYPHWKTLFNGAFRVIHQMPIVAKCHCCRLAPSSVHWSHLPSSPTAESTLRKHVGQVNQGFT